MWRNKSNGGWRCRVKAGRTKYASSRRWQLRQQLNQSLGLREQLLMGASRELNHVHGIALRGRRSQPPLLDTGVKNQQQRRQQRQQHEQQQPRTQAG